jgi:hypothetical protein
VLTNLKVLTELQWVPGTAAADGKTATSGIGWTLAELFTPAGVLREGIVLQVGGIFITQLHRCSHCLGCITSRECVLVRQANGNYWYIVLP